MSLTSNNIIHDNYNIQIKLFQYLISIYKYNICTYPSKKEHISAKQKRDCNQNGNSHFLLLSYLPYFITVRDILYAYVYDNIATIFSLHSIEVVVRRKILIPASASNLSFLLSRAA